MLGPASFLVVFAILFLVLRLLFGILIEAVCLYAIMVAWLLFVPFHPISWTMMVGALFAGAYFGFRVIPPQILSGLGLPPWLAQNHPEFHEIAGRVSSHRGRAAGFHGYMEYSNEMHLGTLRIYNNSVFWAIISTCGHLFLMEILPWVLTSIQIALTSFPIGFVFKRWLAQRGFSER